MAPLIVLIALFAMLSVAGHFQFPVAFDWWTSLRLSLAGMFLLTASAHWGRRRADLIQMVPPALPRPDLLVTATGILEVVGALGLIIAPTARATALGLSLLLLAVFPANVHAARQRLSIGGEPVWPVLPRTLLQLLFLAATLSVVLAGPR